MRLRPRRRRAVASAVSAEAVHTDERTTENDEITHVDAVSQWGAHLAELRANPASAGGRHAPTPALPPLPPELAAAASEVLALLRTRIAATRAERDRIGAELDTLARPRRAQAEGRPVYLDTVG